MVDKLHSFTRAGETMIGGMFGGALFHFSGQTWSPLVWVKIVILIIAGAVLITALHGYYERENETNPLLVDILEAK